MHGLDNTGSSVSIGNTINTPLIFSYMDENNNTPESTYFPKTPLIFNDTQIQMLNINDADTKILNKSIPNNVNINPNIIGNPIGHNTHINNIFNDPTKQNTNNSTTNSTDASIEIWIGLF